MKKLFLITVYLWCIAAIFAQARVTVNSITEVRIQQDAQEAGPWVNRLRNNFDVNITSGKLDVWYRARLNMNEWGNTNYTTWEQKVTRWLLPGLGDAQIRAIIRPIQDLTIGIGTEIVWDLGPISLWDDDYYHVGYGNAYRSFWDYQNNKFSGVRPSWTNVDNSAFGSWEKARRPQRFAYNGFAVKYALFGAEAGACIPFQDIALLKNSNTDNFSVRWGVKYTMPKVFSIGAGWASTFNLDKNPWSIYAGATLEILPTVKPELFFTLLRRGLNFKQDLVMQTNIGARIRMKFQDIAIDPEFAVSIDSQGSETSKNSRSTFEATYLTPFFAAIPISYKVNNVITLQLWTSFATGDKKAFLDVDAEYKPVFDYRAIVRPGIDINTKFGAFKIQIAGVMENLQSIQQPLRFDYLLHLGYQIRAY